MTKKFLRCCVVEALQFTGSNHEEFDWLEWKGFTTSWLDRNGELFVMLGENMEWLKPGDWLAFDGIHTLAYTKDQWETIISKTGDHE